MIGWGFEEKSCSLGRVRIECTLGEDKGVDPVTERPWPVEKRFGLVNFKA